MRRGRAAAYARAVERILAELSGRPVILSPRDWALVENWHDRGVPLQAVLETIEEVATRPHRKRRRARIGLGLFARAVEESWEAIRDGRLRARAARTGALPRWSEARDAWVAARDRAGGVPALAGLLSELIGEIERGGEPGTIDRELDERLPGAVPADVLETAKMAAGRGLAPFRGRFAPDVFAATCRRAIADRLRRMLGLPRLALTDRASWPTRDAPRENR